MFDVRDDVSAEKSAGGIILCVNARVLDMPGLEAPASDPCT